MTVKLASAGAGGTGADNSGGGGSINQQDGSGNGGVGVSGGLAGVDNNSGGVSSSVPVSVAAANVAAALAHHAHQAAHQQQVDGNGAGGPQGGQQGASAGMGPPPSANPDQPSLASLVQSANNVATFNPNAPNYNIVDVWESNLEEVFMKIRSIIDTHHYVAMDTEFPGVVAKPQGQFKSHSDFAYQSVRCNVELLRIIQLGFAFFNEEGLLHSCYQFNFKFNIQEEMYAKDSIDLLQTSGIQFDRLEEDGVDIFHFAELLMVSGLVLMDNVKWISFHSSYDYGYLLKLLCNENLPDSEDEFYSLLQIYFPIIYDVKFLMKSCKALKGGLSDIGGQLDVQRIGPEHQAGSDSILTAMIFFKMVKVYFEDHLDDDQYAGQLFGLGASK